MERETSEKKRLSRLENETLNWESDRMRACRLVEGTDVSLPIIGNLRSGLVAGPPPSALANTSFCYPPPSSEGAGLRPTRSSRVLEVVEGESVA